MWRKTFWRWVKWSWGYLRYPVGVVLVLIGIIGLVLPGIQGILTIILGLMCLFPHIHWHGEWEHCKDEWRQSGWRVIYIAPRRWWQNGLKRLPHPHFRHKSEATKSATPEKDLTT